MKRSLLLVALLVAACAGELGDADLPPLPVPARLDEVDPPVHSQYQELRAVLDGLLERQAAPAAELATAYGRLGMWHQVYGDFELASLAYRHAGALDPAADRWIYYLGIVHGELGETAAARQAFGRYLARHPDAAPALVRLAEVELMAGGDEKAAPLLEKALAADPRNARALAVLGRTALGRRDFAAAARHLQAALELQPGAELVRYSLGLAYRGLGDLEQAALYMPAGRIDNRQKRDAVLFDPLYAEIEALNQGSRRHTSEGRQAFQAGEFERAVAAAREAVAANPADPGPRLNLGAALLRAGHAEEAAEVLEEALRLSPDNPVALFNLAATWNRLGRTAEAEDRYRAAVAANPGFKEARFNLANLLRERGELAAALEQYERVVELDPGLPHARTWRAVCLAELGRGAEARARLERDLVELPGKEQLELAYVRLLATAPAAAARDGARALALAEQLFRVRPTVPWAEAVAAAHAERGDFERAAALQETALAAARETGSGELLARISRRLAGYRRGEPCREIWAANELEGAQPVAAGEAGQ